MVWHGMVWYGMVLYANTLLILMLMLMLMLMIMLMLMLILVLILILMLIRIPYYSSGMASRSEGLALWLADCSSAQWTSVSFYLHIKMLLKTLGM